MTVPPEARIGSIDPRTACPTASHAERVRVSASRQRAVTSSA